MSDKEYHQDNLHIYNIDCMELMKRYPDKYFDLAIVDPPYGIGEDGSKNKTRGFLVQAKDYKPYHGNDSKAPDQNYFDELFRISKKQIIWGENYLNFSQKNTSTGRLYWNKMTGNNDFSNGEIAWTNLFNSVREFIFMWSGMMQGKSIHEGYLQQGNKKLNEVRIHPNQKPVALYNWFLENYSKPEFKIIDTHSGSGSNAISNHYFKTSEFVASEIDTHYFNESIKRIKKETAQLSFI